MERIRWIDHSGLRILVVDFSNLLENKFLRLIDEATQFQINLKQKEVFAIYDISNTRTTPKIMQAGKASVKQFAQHSLKRKVAMVGFNKMQRILARIVMKDIYLASDFDDALTWLSRHSKRNLGAKLSLNEK